MLKPREYPGLVAVPRNFFGGTIEGAYIYVREDDPSLKKEPTVQPQLTLHNIRYGHATNSSSSHSVVLLRPGDSATKLGDRNKRGDGEFGWEGFVLGTKNSKEEYLITQLWHELRRTEVSVDFAKAVMLDFLGINVDALDYDVSKGYVDHQSQWDFGNPLSLTKDFVQGLHKFLMRDDVVILGGNDNGGEVDAPNGSISFDPLNSRCEAHDKIKIVQDGEYFVFYNPNNGFKTRFSFNPDLPEYTKASRPELVDLKLTNFCPYAATSPCGKFCYEGSDAKGRHANAHDVYQLVSSFAEMGVLEISMGGGSIEFHPQITDILSTIEYKGLTANITVLNSKGLASNEALRKQVKRSVSGIGVSIHSKEDVQEILKIRELLDIKPSSPWDHETGRQRVVMAHLVVGSHSLDELEEIMQECLDQQVPILLLGYKTVGNGAHFKPHELNQRKLAARINGLDRKYYVSISVDTLFVEQYPETLKDLKVARVLTTSPEGKFSCYIDAVEKTISASSYATEKDALTFTKNPYGGFGENETAQLSQNIKTLFAKY